MAGSVQRLLDAVVTEAVGEVAARSDSAVTEERMTARLGCRDVPELIERTMRCSRSTAGRYRRAAKAIRRETSMVTGELLPAPLPATRDALLSGELGLDGLLAVVGPLEGIGGRADHEKLLLADATLAAQARGEGPDAAPPASADVLRMHAQAWAAVLDEDGAEPRERATIRHRAITLDTRTAAHLEGCDEPVSLATAHRAACAGATQRVLLTDDGRIVGLGVPDRVFNANQRRAIALRDGGCIIPGCQIPAGWSEIHHVKEYAEGGPTHTDNGVLLCWYRHRFLEWNGWHIRMNNGVPEVRAPGWYDASLSWRPVTRSSTRRKRAIERM